MALLVRRAPWLLAAVAALGMAGCRTDAPLDVPHLEAVTSDPDAGPPADADAFLQRLQPMRGRATRVDYRVTGPGGMTGTLEVLAAPGGYRRQRWTLDTTIDGEVVTVEGMVVQTPDVRWTDAVEGGALRVPMPLGPLARAYLDLPPEVRTLVVFHVDRWHEELDRGRLEHPGAREEVLGRPCLVTEVAHQRVCVWEEAGLVLAYEGEAFRVEATAIATDLALDPQVFAVPPGGTTPPDQGALPDPRAAILAIARGDYAALARYTLPAPLGL